MNEKNEVGRVTLEHEVPNIMQILENLISLMKCNVLEDGGLQLESQNIWRRSTTM